MGNATLFVCLLWSLLVSLAGAQDLPTQTCRGYTVEGQTLVCYCTGGCPGGVTPTLTWPGHSDTDRLEKPNITRQQHGQNFTCRRVCGSQTTSVTYTLQVAYGPDAASTNITGPSPFITNGTLSITLTCAATVNPTPAYSWSGVTCDNGNNYSTCIYIPPIQEDGIPVTCNVINPENSQAKPVTKVFNISLWYPPQEPPVISEASSSIVTARDILTCTVNVSKPLVDSVNFSCTSPFDLLQVNTTNTSSSLAIDTSKAITDNMTCYCSANWARRPDLYKNNTSERSFLTEYPAKVEKFVFVNDTRKTVTVTESDHTNVTIMCEAIGRPAPAMLLKKKSYNGTVTLSETHINDTDATHTTLGYTIAMADWADMANYRCVVGNDVGENHSTDITLNVNSRPRSAFEHAEGNDRNRPFNMTREGILIELLVYPVPSPENLTYIRYTNESDQTGISVSSDSFNSHVNTSGPGSNFVTVFVTGRRVQDVGIYKVTISNDFGRAAFYFAVNEEIHTEDGGDTKNAGVDLTWILVGVALALTLIVIIVVVSICRKRRMAATRKATDNHPLTSSAINNGNTNPAFAGKHMDADNDSGIVENGRSSPEMPYTNVDSKQTPRQSDGAGYASLNEFTPTKQQEGVLRKKSARTAAYEVTSITPTGQVNIKQAAPQPNAYQDPRDIKKSEMTLAGAPGGPTPHNVGPKGDEYAMISNAKNKTTITVGPKGDEYSTVAKHGKGDNTQGSPAKAQGPEDAAASRGPPLSMTPHPLDTPGYATLAQMAPDQGNQGDVTSSSGDAAASGSPVKNTSSSGDGTDNYDHFQRDGHDPKFTSQGPDVQYSHIGNY